VGLPLPGSPLVFLPPHLLHRARLSRPHPSGKGRGRCGCACVSELTGVLVVEPTSLNRGEGLVAGLSVCGCERSGVVRGKVWGRWWRRKEKEERTSQTSTVMGLMLRLKLRSPSKIAFDMGAGEVDNKIKTCIILVVV
jgi:hypothetical protein